MLKVDKLTVSRGGKDVLRELSFELHPGELLALVGPNGVGKSTLALTLFGHPSCAVSHGSVHVDGHDLLALKVHERARLGLFLAHQEPPAIAGVSVATALRAMSDAVRVPAYSTAEFFDFLRAGLQQLGLAADFADRHLHAALSGGEKKRLELLALLLTTPKYAILDEIDSGMDTDARALAQAIIGKLRLSGTGFLVISHHQDFLDGLQPTTQIALT